MKTLKLFNAVPSKKGGQTKIAADYGVLVESDASWAWDDIQAQLRMQGLNGVQLNSTFHKSWKKVQQSTRFELLLEQLKHYASTYGTGHDSRWTYIPDEDLNIPGNEVILSVIRGLSKEELVDKCLDLLSSGVALKEDTINDILQALEELEYTFTGKEIIKNKEALMIICERNNIVPEDPVEMVRYLVYTSTGRTILIKSKDVYFGIRAGNTLKLSTALRKCSEEKLATVFNRFKPLLLTIKKNVDTEGHKKINRISKLSKKLHVPMVTPLINRIGSTSIKDIKKEMYSLNHANFFQLAKILHFLKENDGQTDRYFQIRNGKSFVKNGSSKSSENQEKINLILSVLRKKYNLSGSKVFIPNYVKYALPTSEKMFVGNVPMGTKFTTSESIASGVYWENGGGASDLDLSSVSVHGKIGWNADYSRNGLTYSGDMTNASPCATEYMLSSGEFSNPQILLCNVYSGDPTGSKFKIVFGCGDSVDRDYMMNPNNVWFSGDTQSIQKQSVVGLLIPEKNGKSSSIVLNAGTGNIQVSSSGNKTLQLMNALVHKWSNCYYLNDVIEYLGAEMVESVEDSDIDLTPSNLERDTIINLFK